MITVIEPLLQSVFVAGNDDDLQIELDPLRSGQLGVDDEINQMSKNVNHGV